MGPADLLEGALAPGKRGLLGPWSLHGGALREGTPGARTLAVFANGHPRCSPGQGQLSLGGGCSAFLLVRELWGAVGMSLGGTWLLLGPLCPGRQDGEVAELLQHPSPTHSWTPSHLNSKFLKVGRPATLLFRLDGLCL